MSMTRRLYTLARRNFSLSYRTFSPSCLLVIYVTLDLKSSAPPPPKSACALICSNLKAKRVYLLEIKLLLVRQAKRFNTLGAPCWSVAAPFKACHCRIWPPALLTPCQRVEAEQHPRTPPRRPRRPRRRPRPSCSYRALRPSYPFFGGYRSYQGIIIAQDLVLKHLVVHNAQAWKFLIQDVDRFGDPLIRFNTQEAGLAESPRGAERRHAARLATPRLG